MKYIIAIIFLIVFVLPSFAQDTTFIVQINDGLEYKFNVTKNSEGLIENITFHEFTNEDGIFLATILNFSEEDFAHYIEFDDYNFDGYLDMYVHDPCMILANCHGKVYLYEEGTFQHNPGFRCYDIRFRRPPDERNNLTKPQCRRIPL